MDHLSALNPAQKKAVLATDGPVLVAAGAGAGKTRVIAHRILEIARRGTPPEKVLAITFTNKAAAEMRERVLGLLREEGQLSPEGRGPFVSTFHSLGLSLIKENYRLLGLRGFPAIYDRADSLREMKRALAGVGAEDIEARAALSVASRNKGAGLSSAEFADGAQNPFERRVAAAWRAYDEVLNKDGAMDFDDLLVKAVGLLRTHEELRRRYRERWTHIHIDEYQDTNKIQAELAELLVGEGRNICVVGDIDQTIYGWRGAEIENILHFERAYPGAQAIMLEENYRSTKKILDAANQVIANNTSRPEKNLYTRNAEGANLSLYRAFDEMDEAGFAARMVRELIESGAQPRDIAMLYRANFQSRALEEQLLHAGIPYQVLGTRFFERKEVKDVLSFVRAAIYETPADMGRVLDTMPGIGKVTKAKILGGAEGSLRGAFAQKVAGLRALLLKVRAHADALPPSKLLQYVIQESGIERRLKEDKYEGAERLENLRELVGLASRYDALPHNEGLQALLESAALASDQDELKEDKNAVRLMTVHAAKGLEFPYVFITGLEEGLFPYAREGEGESARQEERRLMYVALTRAQKKVYLSYASYRTVFGSKNATIPSSFLGEIPEDLIEDESPERLGKTIYLD